VRFGSRKQEHGIMITRQELEGSWKQVKGSLQEKWGQLTDDDLTRLKGDANQLIGFIQNRTGETRKVIEEFIAHAMHDGNSTVAQAVETAKTYATQAKQAATDYAAQAKQTATDVAGQARQMASEQYEHAAQSMQSGINEAQRMVRRSPMESIAVAFGAGMIAGVVTGLILKSSRS
jgi:uncharacterized protein YjbJ (UPF0337 family)